MQVEVGRLGAQRSLLPGVRATAIANNDVAILAWQYPQKIPDCLGFAIYRTDLNSRLSSPLPSWVGFQGESNPDWQNKTTEQWPIQKFTWKDLTAARGGLYQYSVVPMVGAPGNLTPTVDQTITTNPVQLSPSRGNISCYFNRGILSTQFLAHQLPTGPSGSPDYRKLTNRIDQPGDPLRSNLAGDILEAVPSLLNRALKEGGQCYAALYELSDPELEELLIGRSYVHLVLSNTGTNDEENKPARQALHESGTDISDRMLPSGHIGHNKFMVYVDSAGTPQAVLTGSTNWTATGLCAQSNNSLIIESPDLARNYLEYWNNLREAGSSQGPDFRVQNQQSVQLDLDSGNTHVTLWFSPNTKQQSKPTGTSATTPVDMNDVFETMKNARQAILFLAFQPGTPSIVDEAAECQSLNPDLYIRGAVTDPKAVGQFDTDLYHRSGDKPDATVVAAAAVNDQVGFWHKELLKASPMAHAIIHDKIVVVDPFSAGCAVITGSHNLGFRASYNNDENLLIIKAGRAVAESYASHVLDVYDHYRWRYQLQQKGDGAWTGLEPTDVWEDKYFEQTDPAAKDFRFWFG